MTDTYSILESISDGVFTVDLDWKITYLNRSAEEIIRIRREDAIGRLCCEVFRSNLCEGSCALRQTLSTGTPVIDLACQIIDNEGHRIPVSISTAVLRDSSGKIIGGAETFRNLADLELLKKELLPRSNFGEFMSRSPSMSILMNQLPVISATSSTVLITGETGSGKDYLARCIHGASPRKNKPFVAINCGALPETLLESELFGYKKGAFTGADRDKPGRFALAEGGTLFLDEIGEISPAMQIRLLRVLQERTYEPLGATSSSHCDIRIICATHRDLPALVREGKFRQDFFYRINIIHLELPPLRKRKEDLVFLIDHFIRKQNILMGRQIKGVSSRVLRILSGYSWPGNIRELENIIERSMIFCPGDIIETEHLPQELQSGILSMPPPVPDSAGCRENLERNQQYIETQAILQALEESEGNRRKAAELLGIHYATLYRKIKTYKIPVKIRKQNRQSSGKDL